MMKICSMAISADRIPAKAQDIDDIFQFLFNLIDLLDSIVSFLENLRCFRNPDAEGC